MERNEFFLKKVFEARVITPPQEELRQTKRNEIFLKLRDENASKKIIPPPEKIDEERLRLMGR